MSRGELATACRGWRPPPAEVPIAPDRSRSSLLPDGRCGLRPERMVQEADFAPGRGADGACGDQAPTVGASIMEGAPRPYRDIGQGRVGFVLPGVKADKLGHIFCLFTFVRSAAETVKACRRPRPPVKTTGSRWEWPISVHRAGKTPGRYGGLHRRQIDRQAGRAARSSALRRLATGRRWP